MRILMVSKALVVGTYQRKLEEMAALPDVELTVAVPPYWREKTTTLRLERAFERGYRLVVTPMRFNGHYHIHFYPQLGRLLDTVRPDILHFDEEPFNFSTWLAERQAARRGIPTVFYTWQNIFQRFPIPFGCLEADVLRRARAGLAGNHDAADNLRAKGFAGPVAVVPQFGIDPALFAPAARAPRTEVPFTVGFVGRLVPQKGLAVLMEALAGLGGAWRLEVVGSGPDREASEARARTLHISDRVAFRGQLPSTEMPQFYRTLDVLAGPSLTTRRWKEQFGRMLVEAMATEVPVIGTDSGEIPRVIGDGGFVVPEGDARALADGLERLRVDHALRAHLGAAGRRRVLAHYTQEAVARATVDAYRVALGLQPDSVVVASQQPDRAV